MKVRIGRPRSDGELIMACEMTGLETRSGGG